MDGYDRNILKCLQEDGRMSNVELAERIHLSQPQSMRRVRALEEQGLIRRYTALVSPQAVGLHVMAYVILTLGRDNARNVREVERAVRSFPEIIECHTVSGDFDYILKVVASDLKALSLFLTDRLMQVPGVAGTRSMICLEEVKPQSALPV